MVYDCFTFYNELELLDVRLHVLNDVVDKFVLIENTITYTNLKKPLYYKENKNNFKKFHKKIIHVVVDDAPRVSHPWIIEHYLMAQTKRGLKNAKSNDVILISNLDEIPKPEKILAWKDKPGKLKVFDQAFFYYFLNFACTNRNWQGTKMIKYKDFLKYMDAYVIRHSSNYVVIPDGGWHFSYMGGIERIKEKLDTGSHPEYHNDQYNTKERISRAIMEKKDFFHHGDTFDFVSTSVLPKYLQENIGIYKSMLADPKQFFRSKRLLIPFLEIKHLLRVQYRKSRQKKKK